MTPEAAFSASQRRGLLVLGLIAMIMQVLLVLDFREQEPLPEEGKRWLANQRTVDSLAKVTGEKKYQLYPFNPNFITDYKGYRLGMSVAEIDRLFAFRKNGKYVNSAAEFQEVTGISDSLLRAMAPYFKFPEWVNRKRRQTVVFAKDERKTIPQRPIDINQATREELMKVYGIGPALSERIIKMREKYGGFVSMEQLELVWGLSAEVIAETRKKFDVLALPEIRKTRINEAGFKEIMQIPYFNYALTKETVAFRSMNNGISSAEDLAKIPDFPVEKLKIISLYLEF